MLVYIVSNSFTHQLNREMSCMHALRFKGINFDGFVQMQMSKHKWRQIPICDELARTCICIYAHQDTVTAKSFEFNEAL